MTKHDDDLADRATKANESVSQLAKQAGSFDDLADRYRELEEACLRLQCDLDNQAAENKSLRRELVRTRERLAYYQRLSQERYGFEPKPPPGAMLDDED
jgi:hypothetical protein